MVESVIEFRKRERQKQKKAHRVIKNVIALRKGKKRAITAREKRAVKHIKPVSPRYEADRIGPAEFGVLWMEGDYLSTAIYQFNYDPLTMTLEVQWWRVQVRNKRVVARRPGDYIYTYFEVSQKVYENFIKASSKGRYAYYNIRGRYHFTKRRV